jgi:pimeloyl-ACP methyl ester carboxylesterase
LAQRHRVLLVHLPGYGKTPVSRAGYDHLRSLEQTEQALLELGVTRAAFVGYSSGGYRALAHTLRARIACTKLVLLASFATLDHDTRAAFRTAGQQLRNGEDLRPMILARCLGRALPPVTPTPSLRWRAGPKPRLQATLLAS